MDWKRDRAVSTILAAVAGSPMWPSTRATWSEAVTSVDWVTFRELATTLKPRSTNAFTIPAPIPCEAPVTMAVFCGLIVVYLEDGLGLAVREILGEGGFPELMQPGANRRVFPLATRQGEAGRNVATTPGARDS